MYYVYKRDRLLASHVLCPRAGIITYMRLVSSYTLPTSHVLGPRAGITT